MTALPIPERVALLGDIRITPGSHDEPAGDVPETACVMELAAWLAGEPWSHGPACVDLPLAALLRLANDAGGGDLDEWGRTVAPLVVGITDASDLLDRLAVRRLRETVLPLAPRWPEAVRDRVVAAIEQMIDAIEHDGDRDAASSAAWEASGAALDSAGWLTEEERSASSAADAANWSAKPSRAESALIAAATAVRLAGQSEVAACAAERQRILQELRSARNTPGAGVARGVGVADRVRPATDRRTRDDEHAVETASPRA